MSAEGIEPEQSAQSQEAPGSESVGIPGASTPIVQGLDSAQEPQNRDDCRTVTERVQAALDALGAGRIDIARNELTAILDERQEKPDAED